jgi:hypothetical protein
MNLKQLLTLTFDKNVGNWDRIFRLFSGAALAAAGWRIGEPLVVGIALGVLGLVWMLTGIRAQCSVYYLLGYSTRPISAAARRAERAEALRRSA